MENRGSTGRHFGLCPHTLRVARDDAGSSKARQAGELSLGIEGA